MWCAARQGEMRLHCADVRPSESVQTSMRAGRCAYGRAHRASHRATVRGAGPAVDHRVAVLGKSLFHRSAHAHGASQPHPSAARALECARALSLEHCAEHGRSRRDGARKLPPTLVDLSRARALLRRVESRRCSGRQRHAKQRRPWHHSLRRLLRCGLVRGAARGLLYVTAVQWCMRNTRPRVRRTSPACLVAVCAAAARRAVAVQGGAVPPFRLAVLPHVMLPTGAQADKTPHACTIAAQARADRRGRRRRAEARRRCRAARAARADSEDRPPAQPSRRMQLQRTRFNRQLSTYPVRPAVALNARALARVRRQARACLLACVRFGAHEQPRSPRAPPRLACAAHIACRTATPFDGSAVGALRCDRMAPSRSGRTVDGLAHAWVMRDEPLERRRVREARGERHRPLQTGADGRITHGARACAPYAQQWCEGLGLTGGLAVCRLRRKRWRADENERRQWQDRGSRRAARRQRQRQRQRHALLRAAADGQARRKDSRTADRMRVRRFSGSASTTGPLGGSHGAVGCTTGRCGLAPLDE